MNKFKWLNIYKSPFRKPKLIFYTGKVAVGTPYMLPRKWVKSDNGYLKPVPRRIGFDFVGLGWKDKWDSPRHEWNPVWSFVFFKWQIAIIFNLDTYSWESYLTYKYYCKKKDVLERLKESRKLNPNVWVRYDKDDERVETDYFLKSLTNKWRKKFK